MRTIATEPYEITYADGDTALVRPLRRIRAEAHRNPYTHRPVVFGYQLEHITDTEGPRLSWSMSFTIPR